MSNNSTRPLSLLVMESPRKHKPTVPINTSVEEVELEDKSVRNGQNLLHPFPAFLLNSLQHA
jgi:hypothetical protein